MFEQLPSVSERNVSDVAGEALLVVEVSSGRLSYVNEAGVRLFGMSGAELAEKYAAELLPELGDLTPRRFETGLAGTAHAIDVEHLDGTSDLPSAAAVRIRRAETAPAAADTARPVRTQPPSERLEALWRLVVERGFDGNEQLTAILREGARGLGLANASLARVDGEELVVEIATAGAEPGMRMALERAPSRAALVRAGTFALLDAKNDPEFAGNALAPRCFLASAFRVADTRWVATFSDAVPRSEPFEQDDWEYVEGVVRALARGVERREIDERFERLAYSDALTTLPNRIAALERLDEAIAEADRAGGRVAVLFVDIDGFKSVNDTVGHRGGDRVLAEIAHRLRGTLRKSEYIGRLGGDEFAIVVPQVNGRDQIESIAQRIASVLTFPFAVDDFRFSLSASIGAAIYPDDASSRDDLLASADAAMYASKEDGTSRVRFRTSTSPDVGAHPAGPMLASESRDVGYLLCYQPILELKTGRVMSVEALVRRIHPRHGLLAPERGWSIARDEQGKRALDRWVLREAASQARSWHDAGTALRVDVNLAAYDYREVEALLQAEGGLDVRLLRVEIAPEHFIEPERSRHVAEFVERCVPNGIGFALDGFDGGLDTLTSLSHLPIDAVKLKRPLVESISASRTARAVVEGTIAVARSLGWSVIAKGVETAAQHETLASLGCDEIQGFYVAHPMTANDFGTWLHDRRVAGRHA